MFGLPIAFASPWVLLALLSLPVIWYLLRLTPPKPRSESFPPLVILERLRSREDTPAQSPWWLTLLRLAMAALVILAMAGPVLNPREALLKGEGPLLVVLEDGWSSAAQFERAKSTASELIQSAGESSRPIALVRTTDPADVAVSLRDANDILGVLEAAEPRPVKPDHAVTALRVRNALTQAQFGETVFIADAIAHEGSQTLFDLLDGLSGPLQIIQPGSDNTLALQPLENQPAAMVGRVVRAQGADAFPTAVTAFDANGLPISTVPVLIPRGESVAEFEFNEPVEIRNQIVRVSIEGAGNAAAVQQLDDSNRRRVVGLISGQSADIAQPLLSPLYYINRALSPFSDLRIADTANLDEAVEDLLNQNVSAIVLADVGTLPQSAREGLEGFVQDGGLVIRFAGPRLAANPDAALLPVELVQGDRFIGGALSWEEPKTVAPFETSSPYFGLPAPSDVSVTRQVLALQSQNLEDATWARLDDGTPLITASQSGNGWLVLFHVNSDNNWSNLPLSGSFVEMLRRTIALARSTAVNTAADEAVRLPPMEVLDGRGNVVPPGVDVEPLVIEADTISLVSIENPPGLYGTEDGFRALNLMRPGETLTPLDASLFPARAETLPLAEQDSFALRHWLLYAAAALFILDCLAVLAFAGLLSRLQGAVPRRASSTANALLLVGFVALAAIATPGVSFAQSAGNEASDDQAAEDENIDFSAALRTRFAYVRTGISEIDRISEAGLLGLTRFVASRTALEPADPVGVDISSDELAFYPFLYWAIDPSSPIPDETVMARVDAYMKQGGSVLFDTRDQINNVFNGSTPGNMRLREILASLDIPPLEPVPSDHVLTKAFYLLNTFPGRYSGGDLWVEQIGTADENETRPARAGDGVSTILITSNDFAGAWAIDQNEQALLPITPPTPGQREYAFRVGVNIAMYTMTGNYKADQVHIPALLERLGQ